eukprot:1078719-Ditylum_brightwellii.AAC.1
MEGAESPWLLLRKKTKRQQLQRLLWDIMAISVATSRLHVFCACRRVAAMGNDRWRAKSAFVLP